MKLQMTNLLLSYNWIVECIPYRHGFREFPGVIRDLASITQKMKRLEKRIESRRKYMNEQLKYGLYDEENVAEFKDFNIEKDIRFNYYE